MSRAQRLLELIQTLRRHRRPVRGEALARELGVSLRTLYRDMATLRTQGAGIEGEPGLGYVLRPGFVLPPLMFSEEEIEALVLGGRWVSKRGDPALGRAAENALARIAGVLPPRLREVLEASTLLVGPGDAAEDGEIGIRLREAIRTEAKLTVRYRDENGAGTERTIWPFALGFFERTRVLIAWCELRQDFRHFRTDRIAAASLTGSRYPRSRGSLLHAWRETLTRKQPPPLLTESDRGPA
jgi:predicted DNA-binding transcriptional regulator YafY